MENAGILTASLTSILSILAVLLLIVKRIAKAVCCREVDDSSEVDSPDQSAPLLIDLEDESKNLPTPPPVPEQQQQPPYAPPPYNTLMKTASAPSLLWEQQQQQDVYRGGSGLPQPLKPISKSVENMLL